MTNPISEHERQQRQSAVDGGVGSVRLSGFVITAEMQALFTRYVGGELTRDELNAEVLAMADRHSLPHQERC